MSFRLPECFKAYWAMGGFFSSPSRKCLIIGRQDAYKSVDKNRVNVILKQAKAVNS